MEGANRGNRGARGSGRARTRFGRTASLPGRLAAAPRATCAPGVRRWPDGDRRTRPQRRRHARRRAPRRGAGRPRRGHRLGPTCRRPGRRHVGRVGHRRDAPGRTRRRRPPDLLHGPDALPRRPGHRRPDHHAVRPPHLATAARFSAPRQPAAGRPGPVRSGTPPTGRRPRRPAAGGRRRRHDVRRTRPAGPPRPLAGPAHLDLRRRPRLGPADRVRTRRFRPRPGHRRPGLMRRPRLPRARVLGGTALRGRRRPLLDQRRPAGDPRPRRGGRLVVDDRRPRPRHVAGRPPRPGLAQPDSDPGGGRAPPARSRPASLPDSAFPDGKSVDGR